MIRIPRQVLGLAVLVFAVSCATQSTYIRHDSVAKTEQFSDTDIRLFAETMVNSLLESDIVKERADKPVLAMAGIQNRTMEHIDTRAIDNSVQTVLLKSGKFRFVDRDVVQRMAQERAMVDLQRIDVGDAVKLGGAVGAEYFLLGQLTSVDVKQGRQAIHQKKLTMRVVDVTTSEVMWMDEKEIKKVGRP